MIKYCFFWPTRIGSRYSKNFGAKNSPNIFHDELWPRSGARSPGKRGGRTGSPPAGILPKEKKCGRPTERIRKCVSYLSHDKVHSWKWVKRWDWSSVTEPALHFRLTFTSFVWRETRSSVPGVYGRPDRTDGLLTLFTAPAPSSVQLLVRRLRPLLLTLRRPPPP